MISEAVAIRIVGACSQHTFLGVRITTRNFMVFKIMKGISEAKTCRWVHIDEGSRCWTRKCCSMIHTASYTPNALYLYDAVINSLSLFVRIAVNLSISIEYDTQGSEEHYAMIPSESAESLPTSSACKVSW